MKKFFILLLVILSLSKGFSQNVGINATGAAPHTSAMLDISSTNRGMLIPRMTSAQRTAIATPATGLMVYDTDNNGFWFYSGAGWVQLAAGGATNYWSLSGSDIFNNNVGNVGIGTSIPGSPLSFPNVLGKKISFWTNGVNNDYGIGINAGVMQLYAAGSGNKIAFGYGNANSFNETLSILAGSGLIKYPNVLGDKISFWTNGVNSDYGISINTGVMQLHTAGLDKIAFGYGSGSSFTEKISFYTGTGQVGIGTANVAGYQLAVNGNIHSKEIVVETGWADYVFNEKYKLTPLEEVEKFIQQNKHLPNIPSAKEVEEKGLHLGDVQKRMMEKLEELTLYLIDANKRIEKLKHRIEFIETANKKTQTSF